MVDRRMGAVRFYRLIDTLRSQPSRVTGSDEEATENRRAGIERTWSPVDGLRRCSSCIPCPTASARQFRGRRPSTRRIARASRAGASAAFPSTHTPSAPSTSIFTKLGKGRSPAWVSSSMATVRTWNSTAAGSSRCHAMLAVEKLWLRPQHPCAACFWWRVCSEPG